MALLPPKSPLFPVLLVNFIGMLGYSILMPFLVFLVRKFGGNEFAYGLLGATYPAFQMVGAPILGRWSDIYGRRIILLISQIGTLLAWILFIGALYLPHFTLFELPSASDTPFLLTLPLLCLFLARALDGLTGGNVSVANAYLSDISTSENRQKNFGRMAMSGSLGFIIGPALAGLLGASAWAELPPLLMAAAISLLAIGVIAFYLPESNAKAVSPKTLLAVPSVRKAFQVESRECFKMQNCPDTGLRLILAISGMPRLLLIYFLTFLGFSFFYAAFPVFAMDRLGWNSLQLGTFFTYLSLMMIVVQGPVLGWLSRFFTEAALVAIGSFLLVLCFFGMAGTQPAQIYAATTLYALGNGLMWPSFLSLLSQHGSEEIKGSIQGYANAAGSLASILGLMVGGFLFARLGEATFYLASGVLALVFLFALSLGNFWPGLHPSARTSH